MIGGKKTEPQRKVEERGKIKEKREAEEEEEEKEGEKEEGEEERRKVEDQGPLLSQEEVDSLLRSLRGGEIKIEAKAEEERPKDRYPRYDFRKVGRFISKMRLPSLEVIHRRFATDSRSILSVALQKLIDVSMVDTSVIEFKDFMDNVPLPAVFTVISMKPLRGFCVWAFDATVAVVMVDILLGGVGKPKKAEGREFTRIEQRLIRRVINTMLKPYQEAWEPVIKLHPEIVRIESHPQFVSIVPESDLVVSTRYTIDMGMISGRMYMAIPYAILEPIKSQIQSAYQPTTLEVDKSWIERIVTRIKECPASIRVEIGKAKLTLRELLNLKAGDTLRLNTSPDEDCAIVFVQDVPKFKGIPGRSSDVKSVLITKLIKEEEEMREEILKKLIV